MTKPKTHLIPDSEMTQEELEEISAGSYASKLGLSPSINFSPIKLSRFQRPTLDLAGDGCGTEDSGAMGCPG